MAPQSIIMTFDGSNFPSGRATASTDGMAVKLSVADEILEDGLDLTYEIVGGDQERRRAWLRDVEQTFDGTVKITQDRDEMLRAIACFKDLEAISRHPVYNIILSKRFQMDRMAIVYENGACVVRMDFPEGTPAEELETHRLALKHECETVGINAASRIAESDRSIEDWKPLL